MISTPWAIIRCKFNDNSAEPFDLQYYEDLFVNTGTGGMVDYFRDVSHGTLDLSSSQIFGWYTLDHPRSDYQYPATRTDLVDWIKAAVPGPGQGLDLTDFYGFVACFNVPGVDEFGTMGPPRITVCSSDSTQPSTLGQEMGHPYGLDHSRAYGSEEDYQDPWDIMSTLNGCYMSSCKWGACGPLLNAANMEGRDWLDQSRVWQAPHNGSWTVQLRPLVRHDLPGALAVRVGDWLVEFRMKEGWDAAIPRHCILIHSFWNDHSYLMANSSGVRDLVAGDSFELGDPSDLFSEYTKIHVVGIDPAARTATLGITRHAPKQLPDLVARVFGGVASGGDGLIFVGGRFHRVPPRVDFQILLQLATLAQSRELVSSPSIKATVQREALKSIIQQAEIGLAQLDAFRVPAKRLPRQSAEG